MTRPKGKAVDTRGCDVWLLQRSKVTGGTQRIIEELALRLGADGLAARAVFLRDLEEHRRAQRSKFGALKAVVRDGWRLLRGLWRERPLVVVTFTPLLGAVVGLLPNMPNKRRVISTLHMHSRNVNHRVLGADRLTARSGGYARVVACGRAVADSYSEQRTPYPVRIGVIQNGVHPTKMQRNPVGDQELRRRAGIAPGSLIAFAAGRLAVQKNYLFLLRALSAVEDWCLVIAGEGAQRAEIEAEIKRLELGTRVRLLGLVGHEEIGRWLAMCDAYVLPSVDEGLSLALLEAMGSAAPILASDIPGNREALGGTPGECGWLLPPDNHMAWSTALRALQADPEAGEAAGERARSRQRRVFSEERMYSEYVRLIQDVLAD